MSRDERHGGGSWGFGQCLWSPTRKTDGTRWAYWETVRRVAAGDPVLHLRGDKDATFVGTSTAAADGSETAERPPEDEGWDYAASFYRVPLDDYRPFERPVPLREVFAEKSTDLRDYYASNRASARKHTLFYVVQAGRLQCLNGAYLSEVSTELLALLLGTPVHPSTPRTDIVQRVRTGQRVRELAERIGQDEFSDTVRRNFGGRCCFPGCDVAESSFLRGAHIARWADVPELRGEVANGLCFCLMHDAAFERGLFTLDSEERVWVNPAKLSQSSWATAHLQPYHGRPIRPGVVAPSANALLEHWQRVHCYPS